MRAPLCGSFAVLSFATAATFGTDAYGQVQPPHHAPDGFRNNYPQDPKESFWLWKWEQLRHGVPQALAAGMFQFRPVDQFHDSSLPKFCVISRNVPTVRRY